MLSLLEYVETSRTPGTRGQYLSNISRYLESVYEITPPVPRTDAHLIEMDILSRRYLTEERDHFADLLRYSITLKKYAPMTQTAGMSVVKCWLELNDITIPRAKMMMLKRRMERHKPLTRDKALSIEDIRQWYEHLSRVGKVALMLQVSTGMRMGEIVGITLNDINWESKPVEIRISSHICKTSVDREVYLTPEAEYAIREWLKVRESHLESSIKRSKSFLDVDKSKDDNRLLPYADSTIAEMYLTGLKKAGLYEVDPKTRRSLITSHSLRKFFISQLKTAMPADMVEVMAGHALPYHGAYVRYPKEQIRESFNKSYYAISILSDNVPEIRAEREAMQSTIQYVVSEQVQKNAQLEQMERRMREMEEKYERALAVGKLIQDNKDWIYADESDDF